MWGIVTMDDKRRRKAGKLKIEHWHLVAICLMICDFLAILFSYFLALWVRFDCNTDRMASTLYWDPFKRFIIPYAVGAIVLFWFFMIP